MIRRQGQVLEAFTAARANSGFSTLLGAKPLKWWGGEAELVMPRLLDDLKQRGVKDADKAPIPDDIFRPQAERRVRLGLAVGELVRSHNLQAKPEQIKAHIDELASSYEKPADVVRWYYSDNQRMAEVEGIVIESNVTQFILDKAKVTDKSISFDELMGQN